MRTIKTFIFIICSACAFTQHIVSPKELLASDKLLHAGAGYVIGASTTAIADQLGAKYPAIWGLGFSILASAGKEFYDYKNGGTVEALDAVMSFNGGFLGAVTVTLPISKRNKRSKAEERRRQANFINNDPFY